MGDAEEKAGDRAQNIGAGGGLRHGRCASRCRENHPYDGSLPSRNENIRRGLSARQERKTKKKKKKKMVGWVERVGVWKEFLEPRGGGAKTCGEVLIQGELGDAEIRNKVIPPRKINSS